MNWKDNELTNEWTNKSINNSTSQWMNGWINLNGLNNWRIYHNALMDKTILN